VTALVARERFAFKVDPLPIWRAATTGRFRAVQIAGDHYTAVQSPHVAGLARTLDRILGEGSPRSEPIDEFGLPQQLAS
jgi:thioesterase domain-containing protein